MISVIVPVYNVKEYLVACVESIRKQTYNDLEVILVDDGSTDGSGLLCDEMAQKDKRIVVEHQKNQGLSGARNKGIQLASGDYLGFVDADDTIHQNMYEILYDQISKNDAQIAMCDILYKTEIEVDNIIGLYYKTETLSRNSVQKYILHPQFDTLMPAAWNKLYRRELFSTVRYPEGKIHEDEFVIHQILWQIEKLVWCHVKLYEYLKREDSITGNLKNQLKADKLEALWARAMFFRNKSEKQWFCCAYNYYFDYSIWRYQGLKANRYATSKDFRIEKRRFWKALIHKDRADIPISRSLKYFVFVVNASLYQRLDEVLCKKIANRRIIYEEMVEKEA
jgi:glycosyltransferase involved in cell wall biosynthesis